MPIDTQSMASVPATGPIAIFGAGGHAVSVASVALAAGFEVRCFVDGSGTRTELLGYAVMRDLEQIHDVEGHGLAIAIGDNAIRERVFGDLIARYPALHFPTLVHPSAVISSFSRLGPGTVVMPHATIGPNSRVGRFCIVNTQASIDHDCEMLDFSSLAPGALTGGAVRIGLRSAVSLGAVVKHGIRIGDDCVLGANSYLNKDLPDGVVAFGSAAKVVRTRRPGDTYLK